MQVVYAREPLPTTTIKSIFLAGPTPRSQTTPSWRPEALRTLASLGYDGIVYDPEVRSGVYDSHYDNQIEWERQAMDRADCIAFWVPRDLTLDEKGHPKMAALTTNAEWGAWASSGKCVFGAPPGAAHVRYLQHYAQFWGVPSSVTLPGTMTEAVKKVGEGALRVGGECQVPLYLWKKPEFQAWYQTQRAAGNRLDGATVVWTCRVGPNKERIFLFALHVNVHVTAENRNKTNEVVVFRPDISAVVLYRRNTFDWRDTKVALVREFRSPAHTLDGMIHELPGGSSWKAKESPVEVAAHEVEEETGFKLDPSRIRWHSARQIAGTLSAHKGAVFSAALTPQEMSSLEAQTGYHGVVEDTERTYVEVKTVQEILSNDLVDWSTLGMILNVVAP